MIPPSNTYLNEKALHLHVHRFHVVHPPCMLDIEPHLPKLVPEDVPEGNTDEKKGIGTLDLFTGKSF